MLTATEEIWQPLYEKLPAKMQQLGKQIQGLLKTMETKETSADVPMAQQEKIDHEYDMLLKEILKEINRLEEQLSQIHLPQ